MGFPSRMAPGLAGTLGLIFIGLILVTGCTKKEHALVGPLPIPIPTPIPTTVANVCPGFDLGTLSSFPIIVSGNTNAATSSTDLGCGNVNGGDHFYKFTLSGTTDLTFSTCSSSTDFDTVLAVGTSCGSDNNGCNDDDIGCATNIAFSKLSGTLSAGTYWLTVDGYDSSEKGDYYITITSP